MGVTDATALRLQIGSPQINGWRHGYYVHYIYSPWCQSKWIQSFKSKKENPIETEIIDNYKHTALL